MLTGAARLGCIAGVAFGLATLGAGAALPALPSGKPTPAEKKALRVVSVRATGGASVGVMVSITFAGDVTGALGRGNLRDAAVAVFLRPKKPGSTARGIATRGPGALGETHIRLRSDTGDVVRAGRRLLVFFPRARWSAIRAVEVKSFVNAPLRRAARSLQDRKPISAEWWQLLDKQVSFDEEKVAAFEAELERGSCAELKNWLKGLDFYLARARTLAKDLNDIGHDIDNAIREVRPKATSGSKKVAATVLQKVVSPFGVAYKAVTGEWPLESVQSWKDALRGLELDRKLIDAYEARNQRLLESIAKLQGKLELLIKQKCAPPPPAKPDLPKPVLHIHAEFVQAEFSTHYTVVVTSGLPSGRTYIWKLTPPPNDPGCNNRGKTTAENAEEFVWYHGDDVCNHTVEAPGLGHAGRVDVEVIAPEWYCFAAIAGTNTADGLDAETRCERR